MKTEGKFFVGIGVFSFLMAIIYGAWSREISGTVALIGTGLLCALTAFFILHAAKRVYPRPEDRDDGEIDEAASDYGFYSPHSWWPLFVAAPCALVVMGWTFAFWLVVLAAVTLFLALFGFMFEYYRGDHRQ